MNHYLYFNSCLIQRVFKQAEKLDLGKDWICYQLDLNHIDLELFQSIKPPQYMQHAVAQRQLEFYSGRVLTQAILAHHFNFYQPITSCVQRLPQWISPILGSISHSNQQVVVMVSCQVNYIGMDIEHWVSEGLLTDGQHLILNYHDLNIWQKAQSYFSFQQFLTLVFSMKESLYKAVYPQVQHYIDFLDASLFEISFTEQRVKLKFSDHIQKKYQLLDEYDGYWQVAPNHIMTWVSQLK